MPYFRFLSGFVFPFLMVFFLYNTTSRPDQIRRILLLLSIYTWYSLYIAYLQYAAIRGFAGARQFIFPAHINDPAFGIHFDRARGAFGGCSEQVMVLTLTFFGNLLLFRRLRGVYRYALIAQVILIPPAIFFAGLRAGYLVFLFCGIVWCLWAGQGRLAKSKLAIAGLVLLILAAIFFPALSTAERATGGVAQMGPIRTRQRLLHDTLEIFRHRPVVGVGFGHYFDVERLLAVDPAVAGAITTGAGSPHNLVLVLLAETGIVGLLGVILVLVLLFRESLKLYRKIPPSAPGYLSREFVVLFWVMLTAWLVDAMFVDPFGDVPGNGLFWVMGGLMMGYRRLLEPHPVAPSIPAAPAGG